MGKNNRNEKKITNKHFDINRKIENCYNKKYY